MRLAPCRSLPPPSGEGPQGSQADCPQELSLASPAPFPNHFLRKREKGLVPNATFSYPAVHRKLGPLRIINCFDLQPQIGRADWSNARVQNKMAARRIFRSIVPFIMPLKAIKETTVKQCDSLHL